jgi:hypothetical protein
MLRQLQQYSVTQSVLTRKKKNPNPSLLALTNALLVQKYKYWRQRAWQELSNAAQLQGKVAVVKRGGNSFVEKALRAEKVLSYYYSK